MGCPRALICLGAGGFADIGLLRAFTPSVGRAVRYGAHAVAPEFGFGAANVAIFWPSESGRSRGQPHCDPLSELCVLTVGVAWQRVTRRLVGIEPASAVGFAGLDMGACLAIGVWHPTAAPGWLALAVGAAFIISIFLRTWRMRVLVCAVLLPALLYQPSRPPQDAFDLLAFDVGQGSAVLIRAAHHALLFDAGPRYASGYDVGARVVLAHLLATGQRVDRLVLSHADSDHVGGARALLASPLLSETAVLASFPRAQLPFQSRSKSGANAKPVAQVPAQARAQTPAQDWTPCEAGVHWLWDGVLFDIVQPQQGVLTHTDGSQWLPDKPRRRNA